MQKSSATLYRGSRLNGRTLVTVNNVTLDPKPSQQIVNHSPDGFEWGYGGSGPAQLALAILLDYLGDASRAKRLYQPFKWKYIASLPMSDVWTLSGYSIEVLIESIERDIAEGISANAAG